MKNTPAYKTVLWLLIAAFGGLVQCSKNPEGSSQINVFSLNDDIALGAQLNAEIRSNPADFPLLSRAAHPQVYQRFDSVVNVLLNSGEVQYADRFNWTVEIIDDPTLNAFAAPGGYIYFYSGLLKLLERESEFAGIMGHEIAHADLRHSTNAMTRAYGVSMLFDVVLGNQSDGMLAQMAQGLIGLSYSRGNETDADRASVRMLCATSYDATGTAGFFEKLIELGQGSSGPEFLSTHPSPDNRVENIAARAQELNCTGTGRYESRYAQFKALLP